MKTFDVQSIGIGRSLRQVFDFIAAPANLPLWAHAFKRADAKSAELVTPNGAVLVDLETIADESRGTIDWRMTFPDGSVGVAYSRVTPDGGDRSVYSFVLMAPPVPLEALEGALSAHIYSAAAANGTPGTLTLPAQKSDHSSNITLSFARGEVRQYALTVADCE